MLQKQAGDKEQGAKVLQKSGFHSSVVYLNKQSSTIFREQHLACIC